MEPPSTLGITTDSVSFLLVGVALVLTLLLGWFVRSQDRNNYSYFYFLCLTIASSVWGGSLFFMRAGSVSLDLAEPLARIAFISAAFIPCTFWFFVRLFPEPRDVFTVWGAGVPLGAVALVVATVLFGPFVDHVVFTDGSPVIVTHPVLHLMYSAYLIVFFVLCFGMLGRRMYLSTSEEFTAQGTYIFAGNMISVLFGVASNLVLPLLGIATYNWFGPFAVVFAVLVMTLGIVRDRLFNAKVIIADIFVFLFLLVAFISAMQNQDVFGKVVGFSLFGVSTLVGIFLVKSISREVAERERNEHLVKELAAANARLEDISAEKTAFLSFASHQLRTPLQSIVGYLSLLKDGSFGAMPEKAAYAVDNLLLSGTMMSKTIDDFLDASKVELGVMQYMKETFDMRELVRETVFEQEIQARRKGLELHEHTVEVPCMVIADKAKCKHVFVNIIDNAIKYTQHGSVSVTTQLPSGSQTVRIVIQDTGIGVAPEDMSRMFEKFSRGSTANEHRIAGTGVGLFIAKEMVEAQGGTITIFSAGRGMGTAFTIEFPLVAPDSANDHDGH